MFRERKRKQRCVCQVTLWVIFTLMSIALLLIVYNVMPNYIVFCKMLFQKGYQLVADYFT